MGPGLALIILLLLSLAAGAAFVLGTPILGIPLIVVAIAGVAVVEASRRVKRSGDIHRQREQAQTGPEFTPKDEQTLS
jgi:hypothetical protein